MSGFTGNNGFKLPECLFIAFKPDPMETEFLRSFYILLAVINKDTFHSESFKNEMRSVVFALFLIAYCFIIGILGFIASTIILAVAILIFYGARKWYYYAIPIAMVGIVYYVFGVLLHISLP